MFCSTRCCADRGDSGRQRFSLLANQPPFLPFPCFFAERRAGRLSRGTWEITRSQWLVDYIAHFPAIYRPALARACYLTTPPPVVHQWRSCPAFGSWKARKGALPVPGPAERGLASSLCLACTSVPPPPYSSLIKDRRGNMVCAWGRAGRARRDGQRLRGRRRRHDGRAHRGGHTRAGRTARAVC